MINRPLTRIDFPFIRLLCSSILFIFIVSGNVQVEAQDTPMLSKLDDELEELTYDSLQTILLSVVLSNADSALYLSNIYDRKAIIENNLNEQAMGLNLKAYAYVIKADFDSAVILTQKAIGLCKSIDDNEVVLNKSYMNLGNMEMSRENYFEAFSYFQKCRPYFESLENKQGLSRVHNNTGIIYLWLEEFDRARDGFQRAMDINNSIPGYIHDGNVSMNLGISHLRTDDLHKAITYLNTAEDAFRKLGNTLGLSDCLIHKGDANIELGLHDVGEKSLLEALGIAEESNLPDGTLRAKLALADFYFDRDMEKSEAMLNDIGKMIEPKLRLNSYMKDIYELRYKIAKAKKDDKNALEHFEMFKIYSDSVTMDRDQKEIIRSSIKLEYEKLIDEKNLEFQNQQESLKAEQSKTTYILISGSILLLAFLGLLMRNRLKKQIEEKEKLLAELDKLKTEREHSSSLQPKGFKLNRKKIEEIAGKAINETDWKVMNILLEDPVISNKDIARQAFLSVDGIGSALRRMYQTFEIKESRYMKISLLMKLMKISR